MKANRSGRSRRTLGQDDRGSFIVLEAILVAALVLTAILFFTSIQRPTTGSEAGGLDLARYAGDTLRLLQVHDFDDKEFEEWVTSIAEASDADDLTTATEVDDYLSEIVPGGVKYSLRLHNGVGPQQLLPTGPTEIPRAARAASISFLPDWAEFETNVPTRIVQPGQFIPSTDTTNAPLVNPASVTYLCFEAPNGAVTLRDGPDGDTTADTWVSHWKATPDATEATTNTPWKATQAELGAGNFQVPTDVPLGIWRLSTAASAGTPGHCTGGTLAYVNVVPPGSVRAITGAQTYASPDRRLTSTTYSFTASDVGLPVAGTNIPAGTTITAVNGVSGHATMSADATAAGTGLVVGLGIDSPYRPYTLELVLWFGA